MNLQWAGKLASLKFTLVILILVGLGVIVSYRTDGATPWALSLPLFLFAMNLFAAVLTNPVFRRQLPLLVFHLALIVIVLLVALGRLTYMKGIVEVVEGATFSAELAEVDLGPWHRGRLDQVAFINEGFTVEYVPGAKLPSTINSVGWRDKQGREQHGVIGDLVPLTLYGYNFYTTTNNGFAPTFIWHSDAGGPPVLGAVNLPAYPRLKYQQAQTWTPPGSKSTVWIMLQFDEVILDPQKPSEFHLPSVYQMVVRVGEERHELKPGESLRLADGVLEYNGLRRWMGYKIFYDWTLPWLLAAGLLAVGSLSLHFWRKFAARSWDK